MSDYLVRIISRSGSFRALACVSTELVREGCSRHETLPTASAALGRALTGGVLMGALLKTGQRVGLKFEGSGPIRKILVEAESNGSVRGCVGVPAVDLPLRNGKLDVAGALGRAGFLTVTKDLRMKEPYRGTVQLYSSEIAEDLAYYLTESEQVPSAVGLGVYLEPDGSVAAAGGFLIQTLPPQDEAAIDRLMGRIAELSTLSELLRQGETPEQLLERLFEGIPYDTLEKRAVAFTCSCSREKIERVLISLGREELASLLETQGEAEVTCEFCRERYHFGRAELERLLAELS
ncbi:Hsp33 family molecular chaperone HslO [Geobacter sp. AOG1]|uniref:Hsp33 family molecular chaperone HslO n=1 Tax=Geobacter sp. AOG1 TaxID=1566346 RepID=UPI001CC78C59|nr:Hsp33 family molecular chaperone HslO [Geobacter sp. AOG1]GFE56566.1 33 kDa chaperonin [Geobacter sp. AOG1]